MTPAPADPRLYLQRKLPAGDSARWRTVIRFSRSQVELIEDLMRAAAQIDPAVQWRVAGPDGRQIA